MCPGVKNLIKIYSQVSWFLVIDFDLGSPVQDGVEIAYIFGNEIAVARKAAVC